MIAILLTLLALHVPAYARNNELYLPVPFTNAARRRPPPCLSPEEKKSSVIVTKVTKDTSEDARITRGLDVLPVRAAVDNHISSPVTSILSLPRGGGGDGSDVPAAIQIITSLAQMEKILLQAPLIVLYFTANNCPPCKMIGPIYEDMSELAEFDNVHFCKVNVNDCPDVAERFDVDGWPTFLLFKDGKVVDSIVGGMAAKEGLYTLIAKYK